MTQVSRETKSSQRQSREPTNQSTFYENKKRDRIRPGTRFTAKPNQQIKH
jgi:hypothetical protein